MRGDPGEHVEIAALSADAGRALEALIDRLPDRGPAAAAGAEAVVALRWSSATRSDPLSNRPEEAIGWMQPIDVLRIALEAEASPKELERYVQAELGDNGSAAVERLLEEAPRSSPAARRIRALLGQLRLEAVLERGSPDLATLDSLTRDMAPEAVSTILLDALGTITDPDTRSAIVLTLRHRTDVIGMALLERLSEEGPEASLDAGITALCEDLLSGDGSEEVLNHPHPSIQLAGLIPLMSGSPLQSQALRIALEKEDPAVASRALKELGSDADATLTGLVIVTANNRQVPKNIRLEAIRALGRIPRSEALECLADLVLERGQSVESWRMKPPTPPTVTALAALLEGPGRSSAAARRAVDLASRSSDPGVRNVLERTGALG